MTFFYAIVADAVPDGPAGLIRRRPDGQGGHVDEALQRGFSWRPTSMVAEWSSRPAPDWDLVPVTDAEAGQVTAWFRDRWQADLAASATTRPLVTGVLTPERADAVVLHGAVGQDTLAAILNRLEMLPRGSLTDPLEQDFGLRVVRHDQAGRVVWRLLRIAPERWYAVLDYIGDPPDPGQAAVFRSAVISAASGLGLGVKAEADRQAVREPHGVGPAGSFTRLFTLRFHGDLDRAGLRVLQERLRLEDEGSRLDDEEDSGFGYGYLRGDGTYRALLTLRRDEPGRWSIALSFAGSLPPEQVITVCRSAALVGASDAGLEPEDEHPSPVAPPYPPAAPDPSPMPRSQPTRTSYVAVFYGNVTEQSLQTLRRRLDLRGRGRLDDDWDTEFGYRYLWDQPPDRTRLTLSRTTDSQWQISVTYQGDPPPPRVVTQAQAEVTEAIRAAGLTTDREWLEDGQ